MLRTRNEQPSLWESILPEVCLRLPAELERVDAWLDDERFFAPFVPHFSARMGRRSVPLETYDGVGWITGLTAPVCQVVAGVEYGRRCGFYAGQVAGWEAASPGNGSSGGT